MEYNKKLDKEKAEKKRDEDAKKRGEEIKKTQEEGKDTTSLFPEEKDKEEEYKCGSIKIGKIKMFYNENIPTGWDYKYTKIKCSKFSDYNALL